MIMNTTEHNERNRKAPRSTPWGKPQSQRTIAPGIVEYSTAGHGGIALDPERNSQVHPAWRAKPWGRAGWAWYEEDCEWAIVAITFPQFFPEPHRQLSRQYAKDTFPDAYQAATGEEVRLEESRVLRERKAREELRDVWIAVTAYGDWCQGETVNLDGRKVRLGPVPKGHVGVIAHKGGRDERGYPIGPARAFIVTAETYNAKQWRTPIGTRIPVNSAEDWSEFTS
jgi:hypothetical protein